METNDQKQSGWLDFYIYILKHRKFNLIIFILIFILSVVFVFFIMPLKYTAEVSVLPSASIGSQNIGGKLGSIASLAGINLGSSSTRNPDMYRGILFSRRLLEEVIDHNYEFKKGDEEFKGNLIDFFELDGKTQEEKVQKALKVMNEGVLLINIDPDNLLMYVSVTTENPVISAQIANLMIDILDRIVIHQLQIEFKEQDDYLNNRVSEINDSLKISETELKNFLERNPDPTLPDFQIQQLRLRRKIELQTAVYVELTKQLEILKVQNFVNLSPIKILDKAYPPYRKSRPKRIFVLITLVALFGFLQIGGNGIFYLYGKFSRDVLPELRKKADDQN